MVNAMMKQGKSTGNLNDRWASFNGSPNSSHTTNGRPPTPPASVKRASSLSERSMGKKSLTASEYKHAQGTERLEQLQNVYGAASRARQFSMEERVAKLEKENKVLRLRLDPISKAARQAAERAAIQIDPVKAGKRKGSGAQPAEKWKLDAWIRSFSFDVRVIDWT